MKSVLWNAPISDILNHEHKIGSKTTSLLEIHGNVFYLFQMNSITLKGGAPSLMFASRFFVNCKMFVGSNLLDNWSI
jgi:hypothetical protein